MTWKLIDLLRFVEYSKEIKKIGLELRYTDDVISAHVIAEASDKDFYKRQGVKYVS